VKIYTPVCPKSSNITDSLSKKEIYFRIIQKNLIISELLNKSSLRQGKDNTLNSAQKRKRRVELLIDQRLVGFLKPKMIVSNGNGRGLARKPLITPKTPPIVHRPEDNPEERAS